MDKIDVVITWVDDTDPIWRESRNTIRRSLGLPESNSGDSERFRQWDNLQYIFRGIEKYMPWVNHVYLVTADQCPEWLNTDNPKVSVVSHRSFIPKAYLPTFNSNAIDLNLHRIEGLSEKFIYFNDDMFVIGPTDENDFFYDGIPRDSACISPQPIHRDDIRNIEINNLKILNDHFSIKDIENNKGKWLDFKHYGKQILRTAIFMRFSTIIGIYENHLPISHLKSVIAEIWQKEYEELDKTCRHSFRSTEDVNQWLFRNWMLLEGRFKPRSIKFGAYMDSGDPEYVRAVIRGNHHKVICVNDAGTRDFQREKEIINGALNEKFPDKSSFER